MIAQVDLRRELELRALSSLANDTARSYVSGRDSISNIKLKGRFKPATGEPRQ